MKAIRIICEGQTEAEFVNRILWPYFGYDNYVFVPEIVLTKNDLKHGRMHKGGLSNFEKARKSIERSLSHSKSNSIYVTTMFDFYALPADTPGLDKSKSIYDVYAKVKLIENSICKIFNDDIRLIPYIQIHEFETLLFADISKLQEQYFEYNLKSLYEAANDFPNIEFINDGFETAPSKRIINCIPDYDKTVLGISALQNIDFDLLRKKCRHFNEWITKLENLK